MKNVKSTRDLGIIISNDGQFHEHIDKVVTKSRQRCGWVNRYFINNSVEFRRSIWRTYIESYMDYGSQIWTLVDQGSINKLEGVLKLYTSYTEGLKDCNYWQRLEIMKLYSVQRRHERYRIVYMENCPRYDSQLWA